jgi:cytosine/adenosine deaminase-related metal-dependent hydrolase
MADNKLLGPDFLLSHANNLNDEDIAEIQMSGAQVSCTPLTELQMGQGDPVGLDPRFFPFASLGVDCHSSGSAFMPNQMSTLLQWQRAVRHAKLEQAGKWTGVNLSTVRDVFNLATIKGARALRRDNELGSLRVGNKADLVIFNKNSPSMLAVADRDPVAAIVLHSSIRDVQTVIVDGVIRKEAGVLKDFVTPSSFNINDTTQRTITWSDTALAVNKSRERLTQTMAENIDADVARDGIIKGFHLNRSAMI